LVVLTSFFCAQSFGLSCSRAVRECKIWKARAESGRNFRKNDFCFPDPDKFILLISFSRRMINKDAVDVVAVIDD